MKMEGFPTILKLYLRGSYYTFFICKERKTENLNRLAIYQGPVLDTFRNVTLFNPHSNHEVDVTILF